MGRSEGAWEQPRPQGHLRDGPGNEVGMISGSLVEVEWAECSHSTDTFKLHVYFLTLY